MRGLLDFDDTTDPAQREMQMRGLLAMGSTMASTPGRFRNAFAPAAMAGMTAMDQYGQQKRAQALQQLQTQAAQLQLSQAQREAEKSKQLDALRGQFTRTPTQTALAGGGGPTLANAEALQTAGPSFDFQGYADALGSVDPTGALALQAALKKDNTPLKVGPGEVLMDPVTRKTIFTNPKEAQPSDIARLMGEMENLPHAHPMRAVYMAAINKATTHAPGASVNINTAKPLINTIAEGLGKQLDDSLSGAKTAQQTIGTTQMISSLLSSGNIIAGTGANQRIAVAQLAQSLGVGGKTEAEKLGNTRQLMQGLAQLELQAGEAMKGQGAITESERAILRAAAAGQIDFSVPELTRLTRTLEDRAYKRIQGHQANVQRLQAIPEARVLMPFYNVDEPQRAGAPGAGGGGRVVNFGDLR